MDENLKNEFAKSKVYEYLDYKFSTIKGELILSAGQLIEIYKALRIRPEILYSIISTYCKDKSILLEIGGNCA